MLVVVLADAEDVAPRLRDRRFDRRLGRAGSATASAAGRAVARDQREHAVLRLGERQVEWRERTSIRGDLSNAPLPGDRNSRDLHSLPVLNQFAYLEQFSMAIRIIDLSRFPYELQTLCKNTKIPVAADNFGAIVVTTGPLRVTALPKIVARTLRIVRDRIAAANGLPTAPSASATRLRIWRGARHGATRGQHDRKRRERRTSESAAARFSRRPQRVATSYGA